MTTAHPTPLASRSVRNYRAVAVTAAIVVTLALLLTACSRSDEAAKPAAGGDAKNTRVAALGLGDADTLLSLGIAPVAVAPWGAQGDVDKSGVGPWSKELLGDATPEPIYNTAQGFTSQILEKVTATNPEQIIAVNQAVDAQAKKALAAIAPTTTHSEQFADWQVPWEDQVTTIAHAVGKESEGQEQIKKTKKAFEDFQAQHPELKGKRAAVVMPYQGKIGIYTSGDGRGQFLKSLGFHIPAEIEGDGKQFYRDLAPENYSELNNVDYLFVLDYKGAVDALKKDTTFNNLDVVKSGRAHFLHEDVGNAMSMPNPVTIPWAIQKFAESL